MKNVHGIVSFNLTRAASRVDAIDSINDITVLAAFIEDGADYGMAFAGVPVPSDAGP